MAFRLHRHDSLLLLLLTLCVVTTGLATSTTPETTNSAVNATATASADAPLSLDLQLTWRDTSLLDVSLAEWSLREGARELLSLSAPPPTSNSTNWTATTSSMGFAVSDVHVTDVRAAAGPEANLSLDLSALAASSWPEGDALSTFAVSIRVSFIDGLNPNDTALEAITAWNSSQIVRSLADRLARDVTAAVAASGDGDGLNTELDADLLTAAAMYSTSSSSSSSSDRSVDVELVDATPLHRLLRRFTPDNVDAVITVSTSSSPSASSDNSTVDVVAVTLTLRNVVDPSELLRSTIYQAQAGLARFLSPVLGVTVLATDTSDAVRVVPVGDAQASNRSVLLVKQQFALFLPPPQAPATSTDPPDWEDDALLMTTRVLNLSRSTDRRALANLIKFGDPSRPTNDGKSTTTRPSFFLDYMFQRRQLSGALKSDAIVRSPPFYRALFPFVFAGISIDDPRLSAIEQAEALSTATASPSTIPAVSSAALRVRRVQTFRFDPDAYYALLPSNTSSSSITSDTNSTAAASNTTVSCPFDYCTTIHWTNSVGRGFWLESVESADQFAWALFPTERFCSPSSSSSSPLEADTSADMDEEEQLAAIDQRLPAPIVEVEASGTPIWTLGALSGLRTSRLDLALHLRSEDGATRLTVEVATDIQSPLDASATVTSIARVSNLTASPSIFESTSNLVVSARSRFHYADGSNTSAAAGREMLLFLDIRESQVTQKDTSQPCAHCQALFDWCASDDKCSSLQSCVLSNSSIDVTALNMLEGSSVNRSEDVWPAMSRCLQPAMDSSTATDAALLLSSAVRCQMQRLCPFRSVSVAYNSSGEADEVSDERILLWESGVGRQRLELFTPAVDSALASVVYPTANVSVRLANQTLCFLSLAANATAEWIEDAIARDCRYAKYLGRVLPTVTSSTDWTTSTTSTVIDLGFKYLVGPMPTLQVESSSSSPLVNVSFSTLASPQVFLRAETKAYVSGGNLLPPPPLNAAVPPTECEKCSRLALDVCLRDSACIALTDCILGFSNSSTVSVGDAVFNMFKRQQQGEKLSLLSAVDACHSSGLSTHPAWLKLVRASACFSRAQCPISLAMLLPEPSVVTTAGLWRLTPALRRQKLYYYNDNSVNSSATSSGLRIPLQLKTDDVVTKSTSSSLGPLALEKNLRRLLKFDDVFVSLLVGSADASDVVSERVWEISYANWLGSLPAVVANELAPVWRLVSVPGIDDSEAEDAVLEMIRVGNSTASNSTAEMAVG